MDKRIKWLRISYWTAALMDFFIAVSVLIPERMGVAGYVYPMGLISVVAFSWGVMLLFADREPLQRSWILVPTILVVVLLGMVALHAGLTELISMFRAISMLCIAIMVLTILIYGYTVAREPEGI
ncbi:MAG: hypothetical protein B6D72_06710 [gamma proteobacterium symbiont of Ctena orbiculata]|nr:hypothetical protein [Candidatus Thiodiazotropha taylori]PUB87611.1 MAG: hypothetical protein DBP00_08125 [gamma proteobacterium symbiont of Ctena orbiculata]MBT2996276.1 hypothetical protein [Candidatus Thiodiazotropha taylori]MBT3000290.1 hypothetical protein [Candidatus Thiodiazotropha taylori]MBT3028113.1 hypothetical protein [Candidatus Thiodiazotropha taylori]